MVSEPDVERRLYGEVDPRWRERIRAVSQAAAWIVVAGGAVGLIGRVFDIPILAQWVAQPEVRPMQPATALLFMFCGASVITALGPVGRRAQRMGLAAAVITALAGTAIVTANLMEVPFPTWLLSSLEIEDVIGGEWPGRPSLNVGVVFVAVGLSVLFMTLAPAFAHVIGQCLALVSALVGGTVLVAFAYGDDSLRGFPVGSGRMPISAALLVILVSVGVVAARPTLGVMAPVISPWPGAIVLRRLLPLVLAGPPLVVALLLAVTTPENLARWMALAAVLASGLLMGALFTTAAAVSEAARSIEQAHDISDRANFAVERDAEVVDVLLRRLARGDVRAPGFEVAVRFRPAAGWLAGDAALTVPLGDTRLAAILIDVVGHGPHPALAAVRLGDSLRQTLLTGAGPAIALTRATWVLDPEQMASASVVEFDASSGLVRYAAAANPPLLHLRSGDIEGHPATGPVLLPGESQEYKELSLVLEPGSMMVLYSDGVADPTRPDGVDVATVENLIESLRMCPYADVERVADWCLNEAMGRAEGVIRDDASLIVVKRIPVLTDHSGVTR